MTERRDAGALLRLSVVAVVLGLAGALVTVGFVKVLGVVHDAVWEDLPDALDTDPFALAYVLPVCALGGVLVGLARHFLGEHPEPLEQALADFKRERAFDYMHIPQAVVISLISLGFGAALGPEAALVAIIGGLSSLVAKAIRTGATAGVSLDYIGISGALGALFGTAGVAALPLDEGTAPPKRIWLIVPGVLAAGTGIFVFRFFSDGDGYFNYALPSYTFAASDLAWSMLATLAGFATALVLLVMSSLARRAVAPLENQKVLLSLIGGVILGLMGAASSLILFSGHEGIQELINDDSTSTLAFLAALAVGKAVAVALLLATGWKGGRFFPIMFAGAAAGLAVSHGFDQVVPVVALAAGMTAAVGGLIRKPLATVLLMAFIFPPNLYGVVAIAAVVGSVLGRVVVQRAPMLDPEAAAEDAGGGAGAVGGDAAPDHR